MYLSICLSIYLFIYLSIDRSLPLSLSLFLTCIHICMILCISVAFERWVSQPSWPQQNKTNSLRKDKRWKSQRALLCAIQSSAVALWAYHFRAWHIRASLHPQFHFSWLQALTICPDSAARQWWTNKLKQHVRKKKLPHRLTFSW